MKKKIVVIGAGPAGLTAAHELQNKGDYDIVILEATNKIGGISQTAKHKGNRMDIGGHRFFTKSDRVMKWWLDKFPIQGKPAYDDIKLNRDIPLSKAEDAPDPAVDDRVMLYRNRISRIYFMKTFFNYPITLNMDTIKKLGIVKMMKIGFSYFWIKLFPKKEISLEEFFINRFGKELYLTFFKNYTEKVWGIPCSEIEPSWGSQRIKGLSITKLISHFFRQKFTTRKNIEQKDTETSLIEQFLYPKHGPGSLWEAVAEDIENEGAKIIMESQVTGLSLENGDIKKIRYKKSDGSESEIEADIVVSSMPVRDLIDSLGSVVPEDVKKVSDGILYRDFMTCGILLKKLKIKNESGINTINNLVPDNWIYIQEPEVKIGRLQIFNNWSPYMPEDINNVWIGTEYFCEEGDELWSKSDNDFAEFAISECKKINVIAPEDVIDHCVIRVKKAYPAYFGTYKSFHVIREYLDTIKNLYPVGRNGMHRYNNQDHSMLTSMNAADLISIGSYDKTSLWEVNAEEDYHESK